MLAPTTYYINLGVTVGIYSIVALGLSLLVGNTGQLSIGQAAFYGIGAYTTAITNTRFGWALLPALVASAAVAGSTGYLVGLTSVRLKHAYLAMATAAFNLMFFHVANEWVEVTGGVGGIGGIRAADIAGFKFDSDVKYFYLVWVIAGAIILFTRNLVKSRPGRALSAVAQDETSAAVSGIDVASYKLHIFALSAAYAGIAGSLLAFNLRFVGSTPFGIGLSVALLLMIVVGGTGTAWGGLLGAAVLTLMPEGLRALSRASVVPEGLQSALNDYSYHLLILGVVTFLFIVFLPRGLTGLISDVFGDQSGVGGTPKSASDSTGSFKGRGAALRDSGLAE